MHTPGCILNVSDFENFVNVCTGTNNVLVGIKGYLWVFELLSANIKTKCNIDLSLIFCFAIALSR